MRKYLIEKIKKVKVFNFDYKAMMINRIYKYKLILN